MKYKIHVSAYLEESNQLLVSFSSDETAREAMDYQSLAFDIIPYGDKPAKEILNEIAKTAPTICADMKVQEIYESDDSRAADFRELVGQSFEYDENDIHESGAAQERDALASKDVEQAEEI